MQSIGIAVNSIIAPNGGSGGTSRGWRNKARIQTIRDSFEHRDTAGRKGGGAEGGRVGWVMTKTQIAIFKLCFCYLGTEMKMIRARGVFNFREMIAHVNSNKELQDLRSLPPRRSRCACRDRLCRDQPLVPYRPGPIEQGAAFSIAQVRHHLR